MQRVPVEEPLQPSPEEPQPAEEERRGGAGKPPARLAPAGRALLAAALALAVWLSCAAALRSGWAGGRLPGRLPPPPGPSEDLIQLEAAAPTVQWRLGTEGNSGQTCDQVCDAHGQKCDEGALTAVDSKAEVEYAASAADHECKGTKGWAYDESPSVCTNSKCCGDGSCTDTCTFGNNGKRGCNVRPGGHHSRLCPCGGGGGDKTTPEPHVSNVIDTDSAGLEKLYKRKRKYLLFLVAPYCGVCQKIMAPGGVLEKVAKKLAMGGIAKTYRLDTTANGMPSGYDVRYACEYFVIIGGRKIRFNGNHQDHEAIKQFVEKQ